MALAVKIALTVWFVAVGLAELVKTNGRKRPRGPICFRDVLFNAVLMLTIIWIWL